MSSDQGESVYLGRFVCWIGWRRDAGVAPGYVGSSLAPVRYAGKASARDVRPRVGEMTWTGLDTLISLLNGEKQNESPGSHQVSRMRALVTIHDRPTNGGQAVH